MKKPKGKLHICSRGHRFYKSSTCPVCPVCWAGYYRKKSQSDFPAGLAAPALRALRGAKITKLSQLAKFTEDDVLALHGMGPKALKQLKASMRMRGLKLKGERKK